MFPSILPGPVQFSGDDSTASVEIKQCASCHRKQYVAAARCLCGWIETADSPEDLALKRQYEETRCRKLLRCGCHRAREEQRRAWNTWKYFVRRDRHKDARQERVPSHTFNFLNKRTEIKKYLDRQRKDPRSPALLKGELRYQATLAIERKRQHDESTANDLNDINQAYLKERKLHAEHSTFQPGGTRRTRIVRQFLNGSGDPSPSRAKPMMSFAEATSVEEVLQLMREENDLLIDARKSNDRWVQRRAKRRQTIAQIKKERLRREAKERRERERAERLADQMQRKGELEAAAKHAAACRFHAALVKWSGGLLSYGWSTWLAFLRIMPPPTLEEYLEMELARDQGYQLRGVKMRRKLRLYGAP